MARFGLFIRQAIGKWANSLYFGFREVYIGRLSEQKSDNFGPKFQNFEGDFMPEKCDTQTPRLHPYHGHHGLELKFLLRCSPFRRIGAL